MKKNFRILFSLLLTPFLLTSCMKLALTTMPDFVPNMTMALFEECDLKMAEQSLPSELKLLEGFLKNVPEDKQLLSALCMGFTGYAMVFVEEQDKQRASEFYIRARTYGLKALGIKDSEPDTVSNRLKTINSGDIEPLFWVTMAWNLWININLDKPAAMGQMKTAQECLTKVMALNPDYFYGSPCILMGSMLAARPPMLGGDPAKAKEYFTKAISLSHGRFFLAQYNYAKYYAVRVQDKSLFLSLIEEVGKTPADVIKETCLINSAMKKKMQSLKEEVDEFFF